MSFKDISYLELCRPFCSAEQNDILICAIVVEGILRWSGTIYAFLVEGIMGNIHVKLF